MTARRYVVRGRVQGVGFRWFVMKQAVALGVGGWVRNLPDGSVEVHVQGEAAALETIAASLAEGPPASRVSEVEDHPSPLDRSLVSFRVVS